MKKNLFSLTAAASVALAGGASAAITIDGTLDATGYGSVLDVQQNGTGFGDNSIAAIDDADGSELNNAYGVVDSGNLHLFFGGNLAGFNKLAVFIDDGSGAGQNTITATTGVPTQYNGFTFDAGFNASHFISLTSGNAPADIFVDYADIAADTGGFAGQTTSATDGTLVGGSNGVGGALFATINNANIAGVTDTDASGAGAVTTGAEISISLAELGSPTSDLKITAFVNGQNHDFLSNQILGSFAPGTANVGGDGLGNFTGDVGGIDLSTFAGDQFVTVAIPEPASLALVALGGLAMLGRRRSA